MLRASEKKTEAEQRDTRMRKRKERPKSMKKQGRSALIADEWSSSI
jgi:hypothetical protein